MKSDSSQLRHLRQNPLPKGKVLYCDTDFIASAIIKDKTTRHEVCVKFIKKLLREKTNLFFSSILYSEFWNVLLNNQLIPVFGSRWREEFKKSPEIIKPHLQEVSQKFDLLFDLLKNFKGHCFVIELSEDIIKSALAIQKKYLLDTHDSIHIATLKDGNIKDIVSFDKHMRIPAKEYLYQSTI